MHFETLAKHGALNSKEYAAMLSVLGKKNCKYSHRSTESLELEGTFKGHLVQLPCSEQEHPQLDQVAQSLVQPGLECLQGWGIHYISHHPH